MARFNSTDHRLYAKSMMSSIKISMSLDNPPLHRISETAQAVAWRRSLALEGRIPKLWEHMPWHVDDPYMQEWGTQELVWLNKQPSEAVVAKALNSHQQPLGWQNRAMLQVCNEFPIYVTAPGVIHKIKMLNWIAYQ